MLLFHMFGMSHGGYVGFSRCFWLAANLPFGLVGITPISGKSLWCITGVTMLVAIINPSRMCFMKRGNLTSYH